MVEAIAGCSGTVGCGACAILSGALPIGSSTLAIMLGTQENVLPAGAAVRLRIPLAGRLITRLRSEVSRRSRTVALRSGLVPHVAHYIASARDLRAIPRYLLTRSFSTRMRYRVGAPRESGVGGLLIKVRAFLIEIAQRLIAIRGRLIAVAARLISIAQFGFTRSGFPSGRFISHRLPPQRDSAWLEGDPLPLPGE